MAPRVSLNEGIGALVCPGIIVDVTVSVTVVDTVDSMVVGEIEVVVEVMISVRVVTSHLQLHPVHNTAKRLIQMIKGLILLVITCPSCGISII